MTFTDVEHIQFLDLHPHHHSLAEDIHAGLGDSPKWLNSMYFYDEKGSELFTQICNLEEYYVTRTELGIMNTYLDDIIDTIGSNPFLIELGSGASEKVRLLLQHFDANSSYMAIEISKQFLLNSSHLLAKDYPHINIYAVCADFTQLHELNHLMEPYHNKVFYFPGSTIGNFLVKEAIELMKEVRSVLKVGDGFLLGIDRYKDESILVPAYDDSKGVTAEFNKNILHRIKNELDSSIDVDQFRHKIVLNKEKHRIEMHLESICDQTLSVGEHSYKFIKNETIHTENSYKYTQAMMDHLFESSGFRCVKEWTDDNRYFSLVYLEAI